MMKRVARGDRFDLSARSRNRVAAAVEQVEAWQKSQTTDLNRFNRGSGIVWIKNLSGSDLAQYAVLGISGVFPEYSENNPGFKAGPLLEGTTPDIDDHWGKFAILLEPAKNNAIARATVSGVTVGKLTIASGDEWLDQADVNDAATGTLDLTPGGSAKVLWKESSYGTKWALLNLGAGQQQWEVGKLDGSLAAGGSATVSIWRGAPGSRADSTYNVTAYAPEVFTSGTLASGDWVYLRSHKGTWEVHLAECVA